VPIGDSGAQAAALKQLVSDPVASTALTANTVSGHTTATGSTPPANPIGAFVAGVLAAIGYHPEPAATAIATPVIAAVTSAPSVPNVPATLAVLGWLTREIGYTLFNRSPQMTPTQTGQSLSGVVTGELYGQDFFGQPLTYGGTGATAKGTVVVDASTGEFTYTPSAAFASAGGVDTFTATASNTAAYQLPGVAGMIQSALHRVAQFLGLAQPDTTTKLVTVTIVVNGPTLISISPVSGTSVGQPLLSADGTRAYQTTQSYDAKTNSYTTTVAVVDTTTGTVIGAPISVAGQRLGQLLLSSDGTRAVETLQTNDSTHTVVVINTITGQVVGTPTTITDQQAAGVLQLSPDGTRAFQLTKAYDATSQTWTTAVTIIDTATGTPTGAPIAVGGSPVDSQVVNPTAGLQFSADGKHAYLTTTSVDADTSAGSAITRVAEIDAVTGALVGTPVALAGAPTTNLTLSPDGTRGYVVTTVLGANGTSTTEVGAIDTATGALVTAATTLSGYAIGDTRQPETYTPILFSPDGTRAFLTTDVYNPATPSDTAQVAMFDTATGALLGVTATIPGQAQQPLQWSAADPTHLYQLTVHYGTGQAPDYTTIAVISALDGTLIGDITTIGTNPNDSFRSIQVSADGSRAYQVTTDVIGGRTHAYVAVINPVTGTAVGAPIQLTGVPVGTIQFGSGTDGYQVVNQGNNTQVAVINTADGTLARSIDVTGTVVGSLQFSPDGSRAVLTTSDRLTVINTTTGATISNFVLDGRPVGAVVFSSDGTRAYQTTTTGTTLGDTTVTVYDTATGTKVSSWATAPGESFAAPVFSADGSRAYITTAEFDPFNQKWETHVSVINTSTGSLVGSTITLDGTQRSLSWLNADGTRLVQTVEIYDPTDRIWKTGLAVINTGA
jgi:WD40 repeat protein